MVSGALVLVVDDEPEIRELLLTVLEDEGYAVVGAESGHVALDLLARLRPDLALIDIMLPGIDGRETARRIRTLPGLGGLPVVLMSAAFTRHQTGGDDELFIPKPFDLDNLLDTIAGLIEDRPSADDAT